MADKKFYWLKLQKDFFKRHDIRIIEDMPNGKDYILFYLKLLVESITHEGSLRFSDAIPYNEQMLATITNTNVDIVRSAMKVFSDLGMIDILEDKTIYMAEVSKMIGFETEWAQKKRDYRDKKRTLSLECPNEVRQEKEIEIDKEIEKENKYKYSDNQDLEFAFLEFEKMRKKIKKPITSDRTRTRLVNKLDKLAGDDISLKISIINQSVDHCWQDFYELKDTSVLESSVSQNNNDDGWQ